MKKVLLMITAFALILSLAVCGTKTSTADEKENNPEEEIQQNAENVTTIEAANPCNVDDKLHRNGQCDADPEYQFGQYVGRLRGALRRDHRR